MAPWLFLPFGRLSSPRSHSFANIDNKLQFQRRRQRQMFHLRVVVVVWIGAEVSKHNQKARDQQARDVSSFVWLLEFY